MSKVVHLRTPSTQLLALAMKAREYGLLDYAEELRLQAQHELDNAIALVDEEACLKHAMQCQTADQETELGY